MNHHEFTFPFGEMLLPQDPKIISQREVLILGAYPSSFHIRWKPPAPFMGIKAIAVDNEPSVFWDGSDEQDIFNAWLDNISWQSDWGDASPAGKYNGSSGVWINNNLLAPLGISRENVWFTDCLDIYYCSNGLKKRIQDTYNPFAKQFKLPLAKLPPHPGENKIVRLAMKHHEERIKQQIKIAQPDQVITLGNAALRFLSSLISSGSETPKKLSPSPEHYGKVFGNLEIDNTKFSLLPIAHPAAPQKYQEAHKLWIENTKAK